MYSAEDKESVRRATDLLALVAVETTVRRSGAKSVAICPFHEERTPSFSIDSVRGLFHCFGCGKGGDVFTFVMETQGLTFREALELLADRAQITLTPDPQAEKRAGERIRLIEAVRAAVDVYWRWLLKGDEAGMARAYLRQRGFDREVVNTYRLGYAPAAPQPDRLFRALSAQGIEPAVLEKAGLIVIGRGNEGSVRDYFRGQVLFPIYDLRGDPVGFGGRALSDKQPKYINTRETPLYHKSDLLYGLDNAKKEIKAEGYTLVVEGYTDVIALHQQGFRTAVATCGTSLGERHFDLLRRFSDRVVLMFDADEAGQKAAARVEQLTTPKNLQLDIRVALIPPGTDPAEMCQDQRLDELKQAINTAPPLGEFLIEQILAPYREAPLDSHSQTKALAEVVPLLYQLGNAKLVLDHLIRRVSGVIKIPTRSILAEVHSYRPETLATGRNLPSSSPTPHEPEPEGADNEADQPQHAQPLGQGLTLTEREMLRVLLHNGAPAPTAPLVESVPVSAETNVSPAIDLRKLEITEQLFRHPVAKQALVWVKTQQSKQTYGQPLDLNGSDENLIDLFRRLSFDPHPLPDPVELVKRLQQERRGDEINLLESQRADLEKQGRTEVDEYRQVVEQIMLLNKRRQPPEEPD